MGMSFKSKISCDGYFNIKTYEDEPCSAKAVLETINVDVTISQGQIEFDADQIHSHGWTKSYGEFKFRCPECIERDLAD